MVYSGFQANAIAVKACKSLHIYSDLLARAKKGSLTLLNLSIALHWSNCVLSHVQIIQTAIRCENRCPYINLLKNSMQL